MTSILLISACSSNPTKVRKRTSKNLTKELLKSKQHMVAKKKFKKKYRKKNKKTALPTVNPNQKLLLPTHIHLVDGTLMVLVNLPVNKNQPLSSTQDNLILLNKPSNTPSKIKLFYIDHTEVTLKQYKKTHPKHDQSYLPEKGDCLSCPAMGVDWQNADNHCRLVGKRLPTEEEWESAVRGSFKHARLGSRKIDKLQANLIGEEDGFISVAPVGSFPLGTGPYGAMDMIGNVWEWVSPPHSPIPKNLKKQKHKSLRIAKGGSWASQHHLATISYRNVVNSGIKNPTFGFRCAKSID